MHLDTKLPGLCCKARNAGNLQGQGIAAWSLYKLCQKPKALQELPLTSYIIAMPLYSTLRW